MLTHTNLCIDLGYQYAAFQMQFIMYLIFDSICIYYVNYDLIESKCIIYIFLQSRYIF